MKIRFRADRGVVIVRIILAVVGILFVMFGAWMLYEVYTNPNMKNGAVGYFLGLFFILFGIGLPLQPLGKKEMTEKCVEEDSIV